MTAQIANIQTTPQPSAWKRFTSLFVTDVETRSSTTVSSNEPLSAWQSLLKSWGVDGTILDENSAQSIPAFNRAIEVIASQIASLPISVFESDAQGNREEAKGHHLYDLLKYRPHPLYNSGDFRAAIIRLLILRGDCYVRMVFARGKVMYLEIINKTSAEIVQVRNKFFYKFPGIDKPINSEEILHFKINSKDGICGQSPLNLFKDCLERALAEIKLGKIYYVKGGQVGGLLVPDQPMDKGQYQQAVGVWNKSNVGQDKVGQVGMLPVGFKYIKLGDSLNENQLNQSRARTTEDVSNMTGVHPILLGSMESATFGNVEELNRVFVQFTLRAFIKIIEDEFNTKAISKADRETTKVRFNTAGLLRGDTKARADYYLKMRMTQAMSPNEIRALENMNAYPGGEAYNLPLASNIKPENKATDGKAD